VKRYSTSLDVVAAKSFRDSFDVDRPTGGTYQHFLVPIRGDQDQRFRCAELLNAPTSHSRPFQRGKVAWNWLPHLRF
jgi:hypothetical protein